MNEPPVFWWGNVTGPASFVTDTVEALLATGTAMLTLPEGMPWRHAFRNAVEDALRDRVPWDVLKERMPADELDAEDRPDATPGTRLLERFADDDEVRFGYRPKSGRSIQDYLADKDVLRGRLVWLTGLDAKQASPWLEFAAGRPEGADGRPMDGGMLLLETGTDVPDRIPQKVPVLRYGDFVRHYDAHVFADFLVAGRKGRGFDETKRELLAAMAAEICGTDAELMTGLLADCDGLLDDPVAMTNRLREKAGGSGRPAGLPSGNVLAKAVWAAQMKTLFPLLELERREIVDCFGSDLELALKDPRLKQYEQQPTKPEDLEIGQLSWCASQYMIKGLTGAHSKRLHDLHMIRNAIAHGQPAPKDELDEFLNKPIDWKS